MHRSKYPTPTLCYRTYGSSRIAPATSYRQHRQWSDCAFGEPAYQTLFSEPLENKVHDGTFPDSAGCVLSSHNMVHDVVFQNMNYSLVTNQSTTERQHSVAFITVLHPLTAREKESLIRELLFLSGKRQNGPSKIFIVDSVPNVECDRVDAHQSPLHS